MVTNNLRPLNAVWFCLFGCRAYLVQSACVCLGQNKGSVRSSFPTHEGKCVNLGWFTSGIPLPFYRNGSGFITCESLFAVALMILMRHWLPGVSILEYQMYGFPLLCFLILNMECLDKLELEHSFLVT